jgi:hypothetical protein
MSEFPNVIAERGRMWRQGREAYAQRVLSMLLFGGVPPKRNHPGRSSINGAALLSAVNSALFGEPCAPPEELYEEFRLSKRPEDRENGWPDIAALWPERILLLELKTEAGSHRDGQVDWYLELGAYNYPSRQIDLIYLTTDPISSEPLAAPPGSRYRNMTWRQVADLIETLWGAIAGLEAANALVAAQYLRGLGRAQDVPAERPAKRSATQSTRTERAVRTAKPTRSALDSSLIAQATSLVAEVAADGLQRGLDFEVGSLEDAKELKSSLRSGLELKEELVQPLASVELWIWRVASSGVPLTLAGRRTGVELRFSRKRPKDPAAAA